LPEFAKHFCQSWKVEQAAAELIKDNRLHGLERSAR
jgi:hypothetical protein